MTADCIKSRSQRLMAAIDRWLWPHGIWYLWFGGCLCIEMVYIIWGPFW